MILGMGFKLFLDNLVRLSLVGGNTEPTGLTVSFFHYQYLTSRTTVTRKGSITI